MQVYLSPRQSAEDLVQVTGLQIDPDDSPWVSAALRQARDSAVEHQRPFAAVRAVASRVPLAYLPEDLTAAEAENSAYSDKVRLYGMVLAELTYIEEPHIFHEVDNIPASKVLAGIMFGLAQLTAKGRYDSETALALEQQIIYAEGLPSPL